MNSPCVIARLFGGLGNQLFIYAFARALAQRNDVPLKLDTASGFVRDRTYKRSFLIDRIIPPVQVAGAWESRLFPLGHTLRKLDRRINGWLPLARRYYVHERFMRFDEGMYNLQIKRPTVFNGVWQTPRYFDDMRPGMRELIRFPQYLVAPLDEELARIRGENAVCLAIRRFEEAPASGHITLQTDYFRAAMDRLEARVERPHYFVFAQDMAWARQHIRSAHPITFATGKDLHVGAIQDLYLMTHCRHYIVSNSTLHWWGAWLNPSPDKTVIAPAAGWSNADILPPDWTALDYNFQG